MIWGGLASIGVAVVLILIKAASFFVTGSVAILSSLFDSVQDLMTSFINMVAIHHAVQPADKAHRFGHGKAQGIGALLQAFIIGASAVLLFIESVVHLWRGSVVENVSLGVLTIIFSIILTIILVSFQRYVIQQTGSLSIKTDQAHYTGDVMMNVGVLVSLLGTSYLGWVWLDGLFGIIVAIYLLSVVWGIMKEACAMLMDQELPVDVREKIRSLAMSVPPVKNVSSLKTRTGGDNLFIQFNAQFDGYLSLNEAHKTLDKIEQVIQKQYPNAEVIIHAEPFDPAKQKKGTK